MLFNFLSKEGNIRTIYHLPLQVQILDEREAAHPVTATSSPPQNRLSPHHPEPLSSTFNYPLSPPNYPPSNGSGMVLSPDNMSPTSPPPITTFNARPMNRHQVARQVRYETRRAKVEKVIIIIITYEKFWLISISWN